MEASIFRPYELEQCAHSRGPDHDSVYWTNLIPLVPPNYLRDNQPDDMKGARAQLKEYVASEGLRYGVLDAFLSDNGCVFDETDQSIAKVNKFYLDRVFSNEDRTDIDMKWVFFAWHYGLFLGNTTIKRAKAQGIKIKWNVRDVSVRGIEEKIRPVFELSTARNKFFYQHGEPDEIIMRCGRFVLMHGGPDLTPKPASGPDSPYDMFGWFIQNILEMASR